MRCIAESGGRSGGAALQQGKAIVLSCRVALVFFSPRRCVSFVRSRAECLAPPWSA